MHIVHTIGDKELWRREKTLFLMSRMAPLSCYEKVFRWVEEFDREQCAVCFNTSELEEEVLKALLVCHVPTMLVVTGKFRNTYNVQIEQALKENRLLVLVLQREESDGKGFEALLRNQWVIAQVQHIACGYINPNGSIFGLLAGHSNIKLLIDKNDLRAAESNERPYRWTVAEDKRLLRMFYEDMGIHAIHKALGRPYSTVYRMLPDGQRFDKDITIAMRYDSAVLPYGYWHLWHFNPAEEEAGKNGFHLNSKEPDWSKFRDFIMGEVRYNSLMKTFPQEAEELFVATERNAKLRYEGYKKLSEM